MTTMTRMPTVFLTHGGGPCFFMEWQPADAWDGLRAALETLPRLCPESPRAILVVSAHWESTPVAVEIGASPELVFDYYGFPEHTYQLTYPAAGSPDVAQRALALLSAAGVPSEGVERGWDHGVFIPLKVSHPDASVPVVAMSLQAGLDPAAHLAIGAALAPLRDEGVMIIGSGSSYHNLSGTGGADVAAEFDEWLYEVLPEASGRAAALVDWAAAPGGRRSHPREEHLLPLHVAVGAAADESGRAFFSDAVMGAPMSCWVFGD